MALEIIISSLLSGIIAILISICYQRKVEKRRSKIEVLRNLVGYRFDIKGEKFTKSLNEIFVVFQDSKDVLDKLKKFYEITISRQTNLIDSKLYELFKAMCKNLNINTNKYDESSFLGVFNIKNKN